MTTMEECIAMECDAIEELLDADSYSLEQMIDGIRYKVNSIRKTLEEGDPQ